MSTDGRTDAGAGFGMTSLEERLRMDDGGVRAAVLSRLAQLDRDIDAMVGRGLARDEFHRAQAIRGAVLAARDVLTVRTWPSSLMR